ncbi:hypothetical protein [Stutzerimonas tarimensis]|uniref:Permease of the major facilitator superfamily n=1 Tax=Stutzerimonas tarimensis TaxID=1507735 RepID=A0ABV7T8C2_9GAMM
MLHDDPSTVTHHSSTSAPVLKRISWSAIFAGVVIALTVSLILHLLGTAIGTATIDPLEESNPVAGLGWGAAIWVVLTGIISIFVGGWVAGRLAQREGGMHGILVWAVVSLVSAYMITSAVTGIVRGGASLAGSGLAAAGSGIAAMAPAVGDQVQQELEERGIQFDLSELRSELETAMRQTGKPELQPENIEQEMEMAQQEAQQAPRQPGPTDQQLDSLMDRLQQRGSQALDAADREAMVNLVQERGNMSQAEAERTVAEAEQTLEEARAQFEELRAEAEQRAREAAEVAARRVSQASWLLLVMLIITGLVGAAGGVLGRRTQPAPKVVAT